MFVFWLCCLVNLWCSLGVDLPGCLVLVGVGVVYCLYYVFGLLGFGCGSVLVVCWCFGGFDGVVFGGLGCRFSRVGVGFWLVNDCLIIAIWCSCATFEAVVFAFLFGFGWCDFWLVWVLCILGLGWLVAI